MDNMLGRLRALDESRHSLPGEHWMTFALGAYFLIRKRPTFFGAVASKIAGVGLIARALSGRDGAIAVLRRDERRDGETYVKVASPWPHDDSVRIAPAGKAASEPPIVSPS